MAVATRREATRQIVPGTQLFEVTGEGAHSQVYRAERDGKLYAVKVTRPVENPSPEDASLALRLLGHEASALARACHPGVVVPHEVGPTEDGRAYLLLDFVEGMSLRERLGAPVDCAQAAQWCSEIAAALASLHMHGLIHRDVKPGNVLVTPDNEIRLIDLGLALERKQRAGDNEGSKVVGTFVYSAPEQTGMIGRPVDARADLYSLGIVMFEMLTGQPPFRAADVTELMRLHATKPAPDLRTLRDDIPDGLAEINALLLAKDPDDRVQNAAELVRALEPFRDESLGAAPTLPKPRRPLMGPIGREHLVSTLSALLETARQGCGDAHVIRGAAGSGRKAVVKAFLRSAQGSARILSVGGARAVQTPYAPFKEAFDQLVAQARAESSDAFESLKERILEGAGEHAPYLAHIFPRLAPVLGLEDSDTVEAAQDVYYDAVVTSLLGVAQQGDPIVLFLGEVSELDTASRQVLMRLAQRASDARLLTLATGPEPPVEATPEGDASDDGDSTVEEWSLALPFLQVPSLNEAGMAKLICEVLSAKRVDEELVKEVAVRAAGLPGAARAFLRALLDEGLLTPHWDGWKLDSAGLAELQLPATSAALLERRYDGLTEPVRVVLQASTVLGATFEGDHLLELADAKLVNTALRDATDAHVLEEVRPGTYRFVDSDMATRLYSELPRAECARLHGRAATVWDREDSAEDHELRLYERARHHYHSASKETAAEAHDACLKAGRHALSQLAFVEARDLLANADELRAEYGVELERPEEGQALRDLAAAYSGSGDFPSAIDILARAAACIDDPVKRCEVYTRRAQLHFFGGMDHEAYQRDIETAWESLDRPLPPESRRLVLTLWYLVLGLIATYFGIGRGKDKDSPRTRCLYALTEVSGGMFFMKNDMLSLMYVSMLAYYAGMRLGDSRELAYAYSARGHTIAAIGMPLEWGKAYIDKAHAVVERLGDRVARARVRMFEAGMFYYRGEFRKAEQFSIKLLEEDTEWLDVADLMMANSDLVMSLSVRGHAKRALRHVERNLKHMKMKTVHADQRLGTLQAMSLSMRAVLGTRDAGTDSVEATSPDAQPYMRFMAYCAVVSLRLETDDLEDVDREIAEAEKIGINPTGAVWHFSSHWAMVCYIRYRQYLRGNAEEREHRLAQLRAGVKDLEKAMGTQQLVRGHLEIIRGCIAAIDGRTQEAFDHVGKAEAISQLEDAPFLLYHAHLGRADILREMGNTESAKRDARIALGIASRNGWQRRMQFVQSEHDVGMDTLSSSSVSASPTMTQTMVGQHTTVSVQSQKTVRDRDALLQVSLAAAMAVDPREQARAALDKLLEMLGGERACLWLTDDHGNLTSMAGRTSSGEDLPQPIELGREVGERVFENGSPFVMCNRADAEALGVDESIADEIRSLICAPLILGDRKLGCVYVDSRLAKGVFTAADLDILVAIASQIALSHQSAQSAQREIERRELRKDRQLSAAVQQLLLPRQSTLKHGEYDVCVSFKPASQVAGDWWGMDRLDDGRLRLLLGDVTGHGAGPAMVAAALSGCHRCLREQPGGITTDELLQRLHSTLSELCQGEYMIPLGAVELDDDGRVHWWSAAAPAPLVFRQDGSWGTVSSRGTPIGDSELQLGKREVQLAPGERLLIISDGVLELSIDGERELGQRRLKNLVLAAADLPVPEAIAQLERELAAYCGSRPADDDMTLMLIERSAPS